LHTFNFKHVKIVYTFKPSEPTAQRFRTWPSYEFLFQNLEVLALIPSNHLFQGSTEKFRLASKFQLLSLS